MTYQVNFSKNALKDLEKLPLQIQKRVIEAAHKLAMNPLHSGVKKLKNTLYYRVRVGDYRIVYDIQNHVLTIMVLRVKHRREIYR
ncbi:hypothetical protein TI03_02670 [Achromatium sp. WMS1]|nr:hypothetical protein TI03_02670 [Achromatium sp. WMS1]